MPTLAEMKAELVRKAPGGGIDFNDPKAVDARKAELSQYTPEQYNAILNDPAYADLFKYGGVDRPADYTAESLQFKDLPFKLPNVPGNVVPGALSPQALMNLQVAGRKTPEELRAQYEQQLKDPLTGTMIGYNKYYTDDKAAPKAGSSIAGGAHYGGDYDPGSPYNIEFGHMRAKQQQQIASTPGSILQDMGIDRNNPQAEALLKAQMDKFMKENPDHIFTKAMTSEKFGRGDSESYGYKYFDKKYPGMSYMDKVDAALRGVAGQNALPPRGIDIPGFEILSPLLQVAMGFIPVAGPWLAAATGATLGGIQGGPLGAVLGGIGGKGLGNLGSGLSSFASTVARDGLGSTLGSMASDFGDRLINIAEHPFDYAKDALGFGDERTAGMFGSGELTNINVPGIMPADIVARSEPILHTLEPFIPTPYAARGVTQQSLMASEPLNNVNQFMPPDIAARAGTSSVFPHGPPTLEEMAGIRTPEGSKFDANRSSGSKQQDDSRRRRQYMVVEDAPDPTGVNMDALRRIMAGLKASAMSMNKGYAEGGEIKESKHMNPSLAQMRAELAKQQTKLPDVGVNEAVGMFPKRFFSPGTEINLPIGGVDMRSMQSGTQLDVPPSGPPQYSMQAPQGGLPQGQQPGMPPGGPQMPPKPPGAMLGLTPQGQKMQALQPMARGGKVGFAIQPPAERAKPPSDFTPYDADNPSIRGLATAFDEAIAHHLSLSPEERRQNSARAAERVGQIIGKTGAGKVRDLLGKNAKLMKSEKGKEEEAIKLPDGRGVETTGLALSPAYEQGKFKTCPNSASCKEECLGKTSGNYFKVGGGKDLSAFKGPRLNSLLKTHAFLQDPHAFAVKLHDEIDDAKAMAAQNGNHLGVRLNVLSDINPRVHKSIMEAHPDVTFYDYTKNNSDPIASNHHYTYSSTGVSQPGVENKNSNWKSMRRRLDEGDNVAMAFSHKDHLPEHVHDQETGKKYRVVDGDTHDFRPLDMQPDGEPGVIVGLKNKKAIGKVEDAHVDSHGFFVHYDPMLKKKPDGTYEREASTRISPTTGKPMLGETIPQNRTVNIQPQGHKMIPISNDEGEKA